MIHSIKEIRYQYVRLITMVVVVFGSVLNTLGYDQIQAPVEVSRLRCEYLEKPWGVDVKTPRLSWILTATDSGHRGLRQTAYQILVASTQEKLVEDQGDLWDSGRVESDRTLHVQYGGKPLGARQRCYWKVRVWDNDGQASPWSEPAQWAMGLLDTSDWGGAKWIAHDASDQLAPVAPHHGYLTWLGNSANEAKWVTIDLGKECEINSVRLHPASPDGVPPKSLGFRPYGWQPGFPGFLFPLRFKIEVASRADFSDAKVVVDCTDANVPNPGDKVQEYRFEPVSARYVRLTATCLADRQGGNYGFALAELQVLSGQENVAKNALVTAQESVEAGGWSKANLVDGLLKSKNGNRKDMTTCPATMVRKEFDTKGAIRHATVSVTGLGLYELLINGQRVGDHLLAPEWTGYSKRIQYQTYDVTDLLREGHNAIGASIAGGWWSGPMAIESPLINPQPCLLMRLDIELADGSMQTVFTDGSWQSTNDGPIRRSGIYFGEVYDACKEMPGWDEPSFDATAWTPVQTLPYPDGSEKAVLVAQCNEPIRVTKELTPVKITEPKPGIYVFDLGQNMVGWCRLKTNAQKGTKITLRYAERLDQDGMLYTPNLRNAAQVNEYIWRGGEATVEPHFTYHGFRYVEVTGLASFPPKDTILGRALHSSAPNTGKFSCSNELLNKIMHCVEWGQRGNLMSVPTDCPQRTERFGFTGDIQAFAQTSIFNMNMAVFFTKWINDVCDAQLDDGRLPNLAPHPGDPVWLNWTKVEFAPGWSDAGVVIPWLVYESYADKQILEQHYTSAKRWVDFMHGKNPSLLWLSDRGGDYGDWLNADMTNLSDYPRGVGTVPKDLFATAFFAHSAETLAKMGKVLEREEDVQKYSKLFEGVKAAFNKAYVDNNGHIKGDTQAGYALALRFNLLDEPMREKATEHMIAAIKRYKGHPSTGIQTTHRMMMELSRNGHHDEAWRMLNLRTAPSWGHMVDQGATTIWERWDGYTKEHGFQSPNMNSLNHFAFGAVGEWVWRNIAGINPDENQPGYKHFLIHPRPSQNLTWVKATYDSIRGPIVCDWEQIDGQFYLHVTVPANTTATITIPTQNGESVTEGDCVAAKAHGVKFLHIEKQAGTYNLAVYEVSSGQYHFQSELANR